MNIHQNARLTPRSREAMVRQVLSGEVMVQEASEQFLVSRRTVWKWIGRFHREGPSGMADRSSRPRYCPRQIAVSATAGIEVLRRKRMTGGRIAQELGVPVRPFTGLFSGGASAGWQLSTRQYRLNVTSTPRPGHCSTWI